MSRFGLFCFAFLVLLFASPLAYACRSAADIRTVLFPEIPADVPSYEIVLDAVFIDPDEFGAAYTARVRRVIQGSFEGDRVTLDTSMRSTCDRFPRAGDQGFIVGMFETLEDGSVVFRARRERMWGRAFPAQPPAQ